MKVWIKEESDPSRNYNRIVTCVTTSVNIGALGQSWIGRALHETACRSRNSCTSLVTSLNHRISMLQVRSLMTMIDPTCISHL